MLVRTRPVTPLFDRSFDRSFDRTFAQLAGSLFTPTLRTPDIEPTWHDGALRLTVDLPGTPEEAIDISVAGRALTIGVKTDEMAWQRTVTLGPNLDPEQVSARYVNGRLTVVVGAVAEPETRRIGIETSPEASEAPEAAIEASSVEQHSDGEPVQTENGNNATG